MTGEEFERQVRMLVGLRGALCGMSHMLGDEAMAQELGPHFGCAMADIMAEVMVMGGHPIEAAEFLLGHSAGDDDVLDAHHGFDHEVSQRYVLLRWGSVIKLNDEATREVTE